MSRVMAKPPAEEVLVRFAQRLGARTYDLRGVEGERIRPLIVETLVSWCAATQRHRSVPLMMQACSAIAGLVLNSEIDAKLLVERGAVEVVIQMMRFGLEDEIPEGGEDHAAGRYAVSAQNVPWRKGSGAAAVSAIWAFIQVRSTVKRATAAGAIKPLIQLCIEAKEESQLRQTTGAIMDVCFCDKNREAVEQEGGLEALRLAMDKCVKLKHLERGTSIIRKHVAQALQNLSLSRKVRRAFIRAGLVPAIVNTCLLKDKDNKLVLPHPVLAYFLGVIANLTFEPLNRVALLDLDLHKLLVQMLDHCKNGLVVIHVAIAVRNLALRKSTPDFQRFLSTDDERNQLDFATHNGLRSLVDLCARYMPPHNDDAVIEQVLSALVALIWNCPKNRLRMSNKDVIDLSVLTTLASHGHRLSPVIRQRLAILLADLAQSATMQAKLAELGLVETMFKWLQLPPQEAITRYCAAGAIMNMVANEALSQKFGKAVDPLTLKPTITLIAEIFDERPVMDTLVMNLCGALANLAHKNDANRARIWKTGIVEKLLAQVDQSMHDTGSAQLSRATQNRNLMIAALLMNISAGQTFRAKIIKIRVHALLIFIVSSGENREMVRYALGALRNLSFEPKVQMELVDAGILDACTHVYTAYTEADVYADGTSAHQHGAAILRGLSINEAIRHQVRKSNALQKLSKVVDPAAKNVCEEYVRIKPELNPEEVMIASLCAHGVVLKERIGTTDEDSWAFPVGKFDGDLSVDHLQGEPAAVAAWDCLVLSHPCS